jgi:Alpha-L-arabinofuranosidase B (ABFB) domain
MLTALRRAFRRHSESAGDAGGGPGAAASAPADARGPGAGPSGRPGAGGRPAPAASGPGAAGGGPGGPGGRQFNRPQFAGWTLATLVLVGGALLMLRPHPHPAGATAAGCGLIRCSASLPASPPAGTASSPASAPGRDSARQVHALAVVHNQPPAPQPGTTPHPTPHPTRTPPVNGTLMAGAKISLNATTPCCTGDYLTNQSPGAQPAIVPIAAGSPVFARTGATWIVHRGFASSSCVSFEARDFPGYYLRHQGTVLYLERSDGSTFFAADATFCPVAGMDGQGYSFRSFNDPARYIRHYFYRLYIASDGGFSPSDNRAFWTQDVSWRVVQPWAP